MDIHFTGLFCHAVIAQHDVVIIPTQGPNAPEHFFRIIVPVNKVKSATAAQTNIFVRSGEAEYDLPGIVDITGVAAQASRTTTPFYEQHVPKLTDTSGHSVLRREVVTQKLTAQVKGYFNHPPGHRDVEKFFEQQAAFSPPVPQWPAPKCIAAVVRLTLLTTGQDIVLSNGAARIVLDASTSVIAFWNEPQPSAAPAFHGDFSAYYGAIFEDQAAQSVPAAQSLRCDLGFKVNNVECSNSNYP